MAATASNYMFQSEPRPVQLLQSKRPKYREPAVNNNNNSTMVNNNTNNDQTLAQTLVKANIMYDKRVIRGNTYAAQPIQPQSQPQYQSQQPQQQPRYTNRMDSAQRKRMYGNNNTTVQLDTDSQSNRVSIPVQTDDYLEELVDEIFSQSNSSQTDSNKFDQSELSSLDSRLAPLYISKPAGIDVSTSIESGELFDFNISIEPLLEVLIGKSLDQSITEVTEEMELDKLLSRKEKFEQERNIILAATQRLESAAIRREDEKQRRIEQEHQLSIKTAQLKLKLKAAAESRLLLNGLEGSVIELLESKGHFIDPITDEIQSIFIPKLLNSVNLQLQSNNTAAKDTIDSIIKSSIKLLFDELESKRTADRLAAEAAESARLAAIAEMNRLVEEKRIAAEIAAKVAADAELEAAKLAAEEDERNNADDDEEQDNDEFDDEN